MAKGNAARCGSCHGEGMLGGTHGPQTCPDCDGLGTLPSGTVLTERRLRELERVYSGGGSDPRHEAGRDVSWLIGEVRRAQHALLQILAASQDLPEGDAIATKIRFLANEVLDVYARERP